HRRCKRPCPRRRARATRYRPWPAGPTRRSRVRPAPAAETGPALHGQQERQSLQAFHHLRLAVACRPPATLLVQAVAEAAADRASTEAPWLSSLTTSPPEW